jgi:hypothetical protein
VEKMWQRTREQNERSGIHQQSGLPNREDTTTCKQHVSCTSELDTNTTTITERTSGRHTHTHTHTHTYIYIYIYTTTTTAQTGDPINTHPQPPSNMELGYATVPMKITDEGKQRATAKRQRTIFSPSPTHLLVRLLAEIEKKVAFDSPAIALPMSVFPVPGGPNRSKP